MFATEEYDSAYVLRVEWRDEGVGKTCNFAVERLSSFAEPGIPIYQQQKKEYSFTTDSAVMRGYTGPFTAARSSSHRASGRSDPGIMSDGGGGLV